MSHPSFTFTNATTNRIDSLPDAFWINTELPSGMIDFVVDNLMATESRLKQSVTVSAESDKRSSKQVWITENHWISGFIMHYANLANRHFRYDIDGIHQNALQYTVYHPGDHYTWHVDDMIQQLPSVRKLSFSLQLSDPTEYEGGDLQFYHANGTHFATKAKGSITFFDSRVMHRVRKVKSGCRRALVGWIGGPPWK
jgi:predicted 2-oxoglutarate/Fe(II)-dependent dioxygenase YbiX